MIIVQWRIQQEDIHQFYTVGFNEGSLPGLEKSLVLPVLDRFLKLKTDLFLDKKLKYRSIKLCISQDFAIHRLTLSPVRIVHT